MNSNQFERDLKANLPGLVHFSTTHRALYSTDSSNYRQIPIAVVYPKTSDDIIHAVDICRSYDVPILNRGGGTSLAGQTTNVAVVMDHSAHYNKLLSLDPKKKIAVVQPGIVLDDLRDAAEKFALTFGPDPATHSRCTLGGMIGNNSCGVHSVMAGKTVDNVEALDVLTYQGHRLLVGETSPELMQMIIAGGGERAQIYRSLQSLAEKYQGLIKKRFPNIPRRVSGYNLVDLLRENHFNVAKALIGTEGTCVTVLEAHLKLVKSPQHRALIIVGFEDIFMAGESIPEILKLNPIGLEGVDEVLIHSMKTKNLLRRDVEALPEGNGWLLIEIGHDSEEEKRDHASKVMEEIRKLKGFRDAKIVLKPDEQTRFWQVREAGLGASTFVPGKKDTFPGWEDSAVPPEKVGTYLRLLKDLFRKFDLEAPLYGHFGQGCIHTRIDFDFQSAAGIQTFENFTAEAADLVLKLGGSLSGEHGDGQARADLLPKMFGSELVQAFREFKSIWDPDNKMNPGKIVDPALRTENLRLGTGYEPKQLETQFKFPEDKGSFARASLRCVGVGACRKQSGGVMCPSYMATHEEKHSTRGRARLLFEMLQGDVITSGWESEEVKESLDLCLACKGCKSECPVSVDMASYKAEFLSHYFEKKWRPREAYAMGQIRHLAGMASWFPRVSNWAGHAPILSNLVKNVAGIHPRRKMPHFAIETYRKSLSQEKPRIRVGHEPTVYLWVDTFCNFFNPEIAVAARTVLEKAGCHVLSSEKQYCCGRPLYDYGFLDQARNRLVEALQDFKEIIREGVDFIFLEPSCASVFRDELLNFFPTNPDAVRLSQQCLTLSEYLIKKTPHYSWPQVRRQALVQGHCHHKSVLDFACEEKVMRNMSLQFEVLDSGCCGMAGSFGFSKEHYEVSQACGERVLFKRIRESSKDCVIIADGFSCREQIEQGTGRKAYHLVQVMAEATS